MDAALINPFITSTLNVLSAMANTQANSGKPYVKTDSKSFGAVTGIIGMAAEQASGSLSISFEEQCILGICGRMLGENYTSISPDVVDAVGELTNMICGNAKREFSEKGMVFNMAIPAIVVGANIEITQLSKGPQIVVPFDSDIGQFVIQASFAPTK